MSQQLPFVSGNFAVVNIEEQVSAACQKRTVSDVLRKGLKCQLLPLDLQLKYLQ